MPPDPYSRSYWRFADEYPTIYDDDECYALWSRLRDLADATWPAAGHLPITTKPHALATLVTAGLVIVEGSRFRIRGMDKHRGVRSEAGRAGARGRWDRPDDSPDADPMRSHDSPDADPMRSHENRNAKRREEKRREEIQESHGSALLDDYYRLTTKPPTRGAMDWLERLEREHTEKAVIEAMAVEWRASPAPKDFLSRVEMRLLQKRPKANGSIDKQMAQREAERKRLEAEMPPEQRAANLQRLGDMLADSGLLPRKEQTR